jgi:hypothetical protein
MADGSIADTSSKFSKESSSSLSLSSSSSNNSSSDDESNLTSSSSNNFSSDDKHNQDEKSDSNASAEDHKTKNLDGLEINLKRCHEQNIDNLPIDKKCCPNCTTRTSFSQITSSLTQFETFCLKAHMAEWLD